MIKKMKFHRPEQEDRWKELQKIKEKYGKVAYNAARRQHNNFRCKYREQSLPSPSEQWGNYVETIAREAGSPNGARKYYAPLIMEE